MWQRERAKSEEAEIRWSEWKGIQNTTLRVTYEAKNQLTSEYSTKLFYAWLIRTCTLPIMLNFSHYFLNCCIIIYLPVHKKKKKINDIMFYERGTKEIYTFAF